VFDTVWFDDGRRMRIGDPEKNETEVLAVNAPWNAVLKWKGVEFTVPLFQRDTVVIKPLENKDKPAEAATPPAETDQGVANKPLEPAKPGEPPATETAQKPLPEPKPGEPKPAEPPKPADPKDAQPAQQRPPESEPEKKDNPAAGWDVMRSPP
jgi:hypothetical protein